MTRRRVTRDDRGAALLLALVVITVISVGAAVLLTFVDTNIRTTVHLRDQAAAIYSADAAMDAAIDDLAGSARDPYAGQDCLSDGDVLELPPDFYGSGTATVECVLDPDPDPSEIMVHCPSEDVCNRPDAALLTLGKVAGEDGIYVDQPTGSVFNVRGGVFSNSSINVVKGGLATDSWAYARGACTGAITSVPVASCNNGAAANPAGDDPGYQPAAAAAPAHRELPECKKSKSLVTFEPGYYDDAVGLSNMMNGNSPCKRSTWWFQPGTYYFDFHNSGPDRNPLLPAGNNLWRLDDKDGHIVAGTPVDASGAPLAAPPVPPTMPGACANPAKDPASAGVQFIFGGDSRFALKSGRVEICGTYSTTEPPVAVYGLTSGDATTTALTGADVLKLTSVPSTGDFGSSATVARLSTVNGTPAATWKAGKKGDTGSLTVGGFAPPAPIPAGSVLKAATVRVTHRHGTAADKDALSVSLSPTGGSGSVTGTSPGRSGGGTMATDTIALDTAATGALAKAVYAGTFTGASITLEVTLPSKNDTEELDAIQLDLEYVAPAFRRASGCVAATPYPSAGCALIESENNNENKFYVQGTTYAPQGVLDLTLNNDAVQVFGFGVAVRAVRVKLTGSYSYNGPVIEVPKDSEGFKFEVFLNAFVCPDAATCDPDPTPDLTARVAIKSGVTGGRVVTVLSWSTPPG